MRSRRVLDLLAAPVFCTVVVLGSTAFRTRRLIEFHLAESENSKGLLPAHVLGAARVVYLHPKVELDDRDIESAIVVKGPLGEPAIQVHLRPSGFRKMAALSRGYQHKMIAIVANDKVISTPVILGELVDELLDITGSFSPEEATRLAEALDGTRSY
jgi:preprotein translocase subunit SecD